MNHWSVVTLFQMQLWISLKTAFSPSMWPDPSLFAQRNSFFTSELKSLSPIIPFLHALFYYIFKCFSFAFILLASFRMPFMGILDLLSITNINYFPCNNFNPLFIPILFCLVFSNLSFISQYVLAVFIPLFFYF